MITVLPGSVGWREWRKEGHVGLYISFFRCDMQQTQSVRGHDDARDWEPWFCSKARLNQVKSFVLIWITVRPFVHERCPTHPAMPFADSSIVAENCSSMLLNAPSRVRCPLMTMRAVRWCRVRMLAKALQDPARGVLVDLVVCSMPLPPCPWSCVAV